MGLGGAKRTKEQRERDLTTIAYLYCKGWSQARIAAHIGTVSRAQVGHDLKAIRKAWRESAIRDFDELQSEQLAKIDMLEAEAWAGWDRSVGAKQRSVSERTEGDGETTAHTRLERWEDAGDPRFLAQVEKCIARRCAILGLDAPREMTLSSASGGNLVFTLDLGEGREINDEHADAGDPV